VESLIKTDQNGRYDALLMRVNTLRLPDQIHIQQMTREISQRLRPVERQLSQAELKMTVTGSPFLQELSLSILHESLFRSLGVSLVLCSLLLMLALRSWRWGLITMMPVASTAWLVIGTIRALGLELSVATAMVTAISIGLGVGYAIHWVQRYREESDAIIATARTGEALLGDFATTWAAFFALIIGSIAWNRDFGLLAAIAMTYAFVLTVLILPALVVFFVPRPITSSPSSHSEKG
jgi:predicted RND superfamily exporter protein